MLGVALGCIRLSYDDFCRMDFEEFAAVYNAYTEQRDADIKGRWERMRMLACITIQPHIDHKKAGRVTPERLLPFVWDKKVERQKNTRTMTTEQQRKRMEKLVKKLGDKLI